MTVTRTPAAAQAKPDVPFPFGIHFQVKLLKLILMDHGIVVEALEQLKPQYFETPELRWVCHQIQQYFNAYGALPNIEVLRQYARQHDEKLTATLPAVLEQLDRTGVEEEAWIKDNFLEWVRQNVFHLSFREATALWNQGRRTEAIDHMRQKLDSVSEVQWKQHSHVWVAESYHQRALHREILQDEGRNPAIPTGVDVLDKTVLEGGLSPGELGIWIAYAKGGKSTMLMNHGATAAQGFKKVAHFVLEGSADLIVNRYDTFFAREAYHKVKFGTLDNAAHQRARHEYDQLKEKIVVIPLLEEWDYTILHIEAELRHLKRTRGWVPDLIIIDYGDLVSGRQRPYQAPWMSERDAFRDMKLLANRGFAVWSASQARRPDTKNFDVSAQCIKTSQIAGGIEKVRVADFIGSINATVEEKTQGLARLWAEMYRDNAAGKEIQVMTDINQMRFVGIDAKQPSVHVHSGPAVVKKAIPKIGYVEENGT